YSSFRLFLEEIRKLTKIRLVFNNDPSTMDLQQSINKGLTHSNTYHLLRSCYAFHSFASRQSIFAFL
ncbi:MAG: hypothetical protein ACKO96_01750, partial [Flammeovirgaceae bacterium]